MISNRMNISKMNYVQTKKIKKFLKYLKDCNKKFTKRVHIQLFKFKIANVPGLEMMHSVDPDQHGKGSTPCV